MDITRYADRVGQIFSIATSTNKIDQVLLKNNFSLQQEKNWQTFSFAAGT